MKEETVFWVFMMILALIMDILLFQKAVTDNNAWLALGCAGAFTFTFLVIGVAIIAGD